MACRTCPCRCSQPGETRAYDFEPLPGTYWMHAHIPLHEMRLLAAPLIVRSAEDVAADRQEVVLFLHDFSFKAPEEVMARSSTGGSTAMEAAMARAWAAWRVWTMAPWGTCRWAWITAPWAAWICPGMDGMAMDLNDYDLGRLSGQ
jgi:FtsP/CotA-like multicopper oxidase with cupredoxin domain